MQNLVTAMVVTVSVIAAVITIGAFLGPFLPRVLSRLREALNPRTVWRERLEDMITQLEETVEAIPASATEPDHEPVAASATPSDFTAQEASRGIQLYGERSIALVDSIGLLDLDQAYFPARIEPRISLWKIRMEVERRLKTLVSLADPNIKLWQNRVRVDWLESRGILSSQLADGLRRVIQVTNHAAHGEFVEVADAIRIVNTGVPLLNELNRLIDLAGRHAKAQ
jgi:hypothetical protein